VVDEITRLVIGREVREKRFTARPLRMHSTVVEADVRYPYDAALATDATRVLAREAKKLIGLAGAGARGVVGRCLSAGRKVREIGRTVARRTGEDKTTVLKLTGEAGELVKQSARETRRLATRLRERAHGRGARAKLAAAPRLEELADRAEQIARQIDQRLAGRRVPVEPHRAAGDLVMPVAEAVRPRVQQRECRTSCRGRGSPRRPRAARAAPRRGGAASSRPSRRPAGSAPRGHGRAP
jgi:hypothetical protein